MCVALFAVDALGAATWAAGRGPGTSPHCSLGPKQLRRAGLVDLLQAEWRPRQGCVSLQRRRGGVGFQAGWGSCPGSLPAADNMPPEAVPSLRVAPSSPTQQLPRARSFPKVAPLPSIPSLPPQVCRGWESPSGSPVQSSRVFCKTVIYNQKSVFGVLSKCTPNPRNFLNGSDDGVLC